MEIAIITTIQIIEMKEIELAIVHLLTSAKEVKEVLDHEEVMITIGLEGIETDAGVDLGIENRNRSLRVTLTQTHVGERTS